MSSFFDAADQSYHRHHAPPLDLSSVAHKVFHPKAMVQPVKKRGSLSLFVTSLLSGCAIFGISLAALYFGDPYGLTQLMLYLSGAMGASFLVSFCALPTRLWYSRVFRTFYKDFCFGMTTMAIALAFIAPSKDFPEYVINSAPSISSYVRHLKTLPTDKEVELITRVLYGEARGEPAAGQKNVVQTIINRAEDSKHRYGATYTEILIRPHAFTCMNPADPNFEKLLELDKKSLTFQKLHAIVLTTIKERLNGVPDPTQGATHYHTYEVDPHWNRNAKSMIRLGNHQFWTEVDG